MLKQDRKKVKLGNIASYINRGITPKYSDKGIFIINQKCIRSNTISFDEARFHDETKKVMAEKIIQKYDILINSTGVGTLGRLAQYKKTINKNITVDSHVSIVRPLNNQEVFSEFVGYSLINQQSKIENLGRGATGQTELSRDDIKDLDISLPPLPTQQRIANILSKYDDLIENNTRRIKILEEQAQLIYNEWFVKFNFPAPQQVTGQGHEDVKMIDPAVNDGASSGTEFGEIPEGWEMKKVGDVLQTIKRSPKVSKSEYLEKGDIPVIDQSRTEIAGYINDEKYLQKDYLPIVVFGDHTRILKYINFPFASGADGTQLLYPNDEKLLPIYFYMALKNIELKDELYTRHFKFLKEKYIIRPIDGLLEKYNEICSSIFDEILNLQKQNQNLKETRDMLIPKLVSGEVEV